jgi:hypothetical protein
MRIQADISPGELIDKLSILEIKSIKIRAPEALRYVRREIDVLSGTMRSAIDGSPALDRMAADLRRLNERLWDLEDAVRRCEQDSDFGAHFIECSRAIISTNDQRARVKREINELLNAELVEQKAYSTDCAE